MLGMPKNSLPALRCVKFAVRLVNSGFYSSDY
jgi:hypothetical protein